MPSNGTIWMACQGRKPRTPGGVQLETGLKTLLDGTRRVAMEYSPLGAIPYVSRVDAGTVELVRSQGVEVVSSGDLVQQFEAHWNADAIASHKAAAERLYRVKDRAFEAAARRVRDGVATTEFDLQQMMWQWFTEEGLISDSAPNVSAQENAGNPHYLPTAEHHRPIGRNELLLLDLWGKLPTIQARSLLTSPGWGLPARPCRTRWPRPLPRSATRATRRCAPSRMRSQAGREVRGYELDRAARAVIEAAGYGRYIIHRTGHSLGETVHGNGAHLDDYETHDERRLLPGTGFTIEPGVYFEHFGVRTEINVVWGASGPEVTGPRQQAIVALN